MGRSCASIGGYLSTIRSVHLSRIRPYQTTTLLLTERLWSSSLPPFSSLRFPFPAPCFMVTLSAFINCLSSLSRSSWRFSISLNTPSALNLWALTSTSMLLIVALRSLLSIWFAVCPRGPWGKCSASEGHSPTSQEQSQREWLSQSFSE
jgi:hypothetical protein